MEQETPRDKKDKSSRHRLPGLCGSFSLMSLVSSICRPRHSLHILAVKNCIRIWTQFEGHLGQWNTSVTAPIILCSRPLWLRRLLLGMVFINRTSIAVLCILNIEQLDNEFNLQFTGPQNPLVQMQSIPYLSKLQQEPLRTNFAGSDILYLSCSHSVLEECIWFSFSHHICHHLALTSSWRVCLCVLPSGHSLPYFCWTCCFSYTAGKNMLNRCTGRILMARLNRYGLRVFSIFWIWKKIKVWFVVRHKIFQNLGELLKSL